MRLRLVDHLCDTHANQAEFRWPIAGNLHDLFDQCDSCRSITDRLHPDGTYAIRVLPDLDNRTYELGDAMHEAAHAVLGLLAEMPLDYVVVEPRTYQPQSGMRSHTRWHDYSVPIEGWAAMCWGGQRAHLRWLADQGLDTRANRVDAVNMGCHDTKLVLEAAEMHGLADNIGWDLSERLLDQHWDSIERVADALNAAGRLSGDEIAAIARIEAAV